MVDRRVPGRAPVIFASHALRDVDNLPRPVKAELLATLEKLRDGGSLPNELVLSGFSADQRVRAARFGRGYRVIYRDLDAEELSLQEKSDATRGFLVYAVVAPSLEAGGDTVYERVRTEEPGATS